MLRYAIFTIVFLLLSIASCNLPDPYNPGNSGVDLILTSSDGLSSGQLVVDSVDHDIRISVAYFFPEFVRYTTVHIVNSDNSFAFDTTFYMATTLALDTVTIVRKILTPGEKKVIAAIHINNGDVKADTSRLTILGKINENRPQDEELFAPGHLHIIKTINDSLLLLWEKVPAADCYTIYASAQVNNGFTILRDSLKAFEYKTANTSNMFYYVIAKNNTGVSGPSNIVSSADTGNIAPQWDSPDTFKVEMVADKSFNLHLKDTCYDADGDHLLFKLIEGAPFGDIIENGIYTFSVSEKDTGSYLIKIVAFDPDNLTDTLCLNMTIFPSSESDTSMEDDLAPSMRIVEPAENGNRVFSEPAIIKIVCKDENGIKKVEYLFKGAITEIVSSDSVYTATVTGLTAGGSDTITFKVTDNSANAKSAEFPVIIKFNRVVNALTLVSPIGDLSGVSCTPEFTWSSGDDPDGDKVYYKVMYGTSQLSLASQSPELTEKEYTVPQGNALNSASEYYWQVIAYTTVFRDTSWSPVQKFTTIGMAPIVTLHPVNQSAKIGQAVSFSVTATGTDIQYQWQRAGVDIPAAIAATWITSQVVKEDNGVAIRCKVYNTVDTAFSQPGIITVLTMVTYDDNGALTGIAPADTVGYAEYATVIIKGGNTLARSGNIFDGWSRVPDGSGKVYNANDTLKMPAGGVTLYARWTVQTCRVTFESNGGTAVAAQDVTYNGVAAVSTAPIKNGYSFGGWYISNTLNTEFDFAATPVLAARTLYAKWNLVTYSITYVFNGGILAAANPASYNVESQPVKLNNPVKIDSTFTGWYTSSSVTGTPVTQIPTGSYGNKTFHAGWVWANTVTDIDGNVYPTVKIGNQIWTSVNLRVTRFNDGSAIKHVPDSVEWFISGVGAAYCFYANTANLIEQVKYGALYNRTAVNNSLIAPPGWHVPTADDWLKLKEFLCNDTTPENNTAKAIASQKDWDYSDSVGAPGFPLGINDRTRYNAKPAGHRGLYISSDAFEDKGSVTYWWIPQSGDPESHYFIQIRNSSKYLFDAKSWRINGKEGCSVRLIKD
ncbi:MAG: InlB B-repeat-containing protein [Chitinispirillaceae bacterium]|nr:InlB B-repeat-containing protein [Chitinispirillaceae bacterium]